MIRAEKFTSKRPDGTVVTVTRNIDTGDQSVEIAGGVEPEGPSETLASVDGEPKGNAAREEWAAWADELGVEYPEDAKRDEIKALITDAESADSGDGEPVDPDAGEQD